MPNRYLRASYIDSRRVNQLSAAGERLFCRLLVHVDDFGRAESDPDLLRGKLFARQLHRITAKDISTWLRELALNELIITYTAGGEQYLQMQRWEKGRAKNSKYPSPPAGSAQLAPPPPQSSSSAAVNSRTPYRPSPAPKSRRVSENTPLMIRIGSWFGRKPDTLWGIPEAQALKRINPQPAELDTLEKYYTAKIPEKQDFRRRRVETLLNNWPGEIDKATAFNNQPQDWTEEL